MIWINDVSKIQEIRAVQALADVGVEIIVSRKDSRKFQPLKQLFDMAYSVSDVGHGTELSELIHINHQKPETSVFGVTKPLIFSTRIFYVMQRCWPEERLNKYVFVGLLTNQRKQVISDWLSSSLGMGVGCLKRNAFKAIQFKVKNKFSIPHSTKERCGDLLLWSSTKGRYFPIKTWDEEYYGVMLDSQFVLCPSGDFIWTYRFFEAIICGAIPIVEEKCELYERYTYFMMDDDAAAMKWTSEIADRNFEICLDHLCLSEADVRRVLSNC